MAWNLAERDIKGLATRSGNIANQVFGEDIVTARGTHGRLIRGLKRLPTSAGSQSMVTPNPGTCAVKSAWTSRLNGQVLGCTIRPRTAMRSHPITASTGPAVISAKFKSAALEFESTTIESRFPTSVQAKEKEGQRTRQSIVCKLLPISGVAISS